MSFEQALFLLPYFICTCITLGVFFYTWRYWNTKGASAYLWYMSGQVLWAIGFLFETLSPRLAEKIFWDGFQWLPASWSAVAFFAFAIDFTNRKLKKPKQTLLLLSIVPALFTLALLTDNWHHLIYPNPRLVQAAFFPEMTYDFTWAVYLITLYGCILMFTGLWMLLRHFPLAKNFYRRQVSTIALGFFIPVGIGILTTLGVEFKPYRDVSPITFAIGNLIVAWGLFRYHTFDIVPIARDIVVENMHDLVAVLDAKNRIVDVNRVASETLGMKGEEIIGRHAKLVFAQWPLLLNEFGNPENLHTSLALNNNGKIVHYEINSTLLYDRRSVYLGRVFVARDITSHIELTDQLEKRVLERTQELAEAYDTTLQGWARALELRDKETEGHSRRVTQMTLHLAQALNIPDDELVHIRRGALLHDIGKMAIPDEILRKGSNLTEIEKEIVSQHPAIAHKLLSPIAYLGKALEIPYCHHEHWDGSGYPRGLKGEQIPLAARIFTIADIWDALLSDRSYRKAWSREKALAYLKENSSVLFDPEILQVFLDLLEQGRI
jgi:PAS domain S-box-containing protein/putative nucleotidyltransferase with HDIG domain